MNNLSEQVARRHFLILWISNFSNLGWVAYRRDQQAMPGLNHVDKSGFHQSSFHRAQFSGPRLKIPFPIPSSGVKAHRERSIALKFEQPVSRGIVIKFPQSPQARWNGYTMLDGGFSKLSCQFWGPVDDALLSSEGENIYQRLLSHCSSAPSPARHPKQSSNADTKVNLPCIGSILSYETNILNGVLFHSP